MRFISVLMIVFGLGASLAAISFADEIERLPKVAYGFSVVDMGLSAQECADYDKIDIQKTQSIHVFNDFGKLEGKILKLLGEIGNNNAALMQKIADRIVGIVQQIMTASGSTAAWVCVSASLPTNAYDIPRWHMDGYYFRPQEPNSLMCKFIMTLAGPSTLFYQLPPESRQELGMKTFDRFYMHRVCTSDKIVEPKRGQGILFLSGQRMWAALHSEPKMDRKRLFFSVVPCTQEQVAELKTKVARTSVLDDI